MSIKSQHIILLGLVLTFCIGFTMMVNVSESPKVTLQTTQKVFEAGDEIPLDFEYKGNIQTQLLLKSSYGSTVLSSATGKYTIPKYVAKKKGRLQYVLFHNSKRIFEGYLVITSKSTSAIDLESYIGPPSIVAGGTDYTMHVVIPADIYDNPLADDTPMVFKHQFLGIEKENVHYTKDMIGWKNTFSYDKKGKVLLSSEIGDINSKEFTVDVFSALPEDFEIFGFREHQYADGNQVTKFTTEVIKDQYNNIISDGTMVSFVIKNTKGAILTSNGVTVNGIATAKVLHPDHKDSWEVKAFINGIAESNTLTFDFDPVLKDFEVDFSSDNRRITVGPLTSFMEQLIPNGALVKLEVYKEGKELETKMKTSSDGKVVYILEAGFFPSGSYDIVITSLGVEKTVKNVNLE